MANVVADENKYRDEFKYKNKPMLQKQLTDANSIHNIFIQQLL
jgi:hypothetical protein